MKVLEKKIISKIYRIETKKTILSFISTATLIVSLLFLLIFFYQIFVEIFNEQQTGDMFVIFTEGREVFISQFKDFFNVVLNEIPYEVTFVILFLFLFIIFIGLNIVKNSGKIKNKVQAIIHYWGKEN
jgi:hypothetical protein